MAIKDKINNKELILRNVNVERIYINEKSDDKFIFKSIAKYKIKNNKDGKVNINLKVKSAFKPEAVFNAFFEFSIIIDFDSAVENSEIEKNIEDIAYSVGGEISLLLSVITKSMTGSPLIIPPAVDEFIKDED